MAFGMFFQDFEHGIIFVAKHKNEGYDGRGKCNCSSVRSI